MRAAWNQGDSRAGFGMHARSERLPFLRSFPTILLTVSSNAPSALVFLSSPRLWVTLDTFVGHRLGR